jgi:hypothetical protein
LGISQGGIAIATVEYDDRLYVFVQASDGHLWVRWWDGSEWQPWADHGTPPGLAVVPADSIAVVTDPSNNLYVFVQGSDGGLWARWWDGSSWRWEGYGGPPAAVHAPGSIGAPAAVTYQNSVYVFVQAFSGHLWVLWRDGSTWQWADQGTPPGLTIDAGAIAAITYEDRLYAFVRASDGHLWVNWWDGNTWQWADQGTAQGWSVASQAIAAITYQDGLYVFVQGEGDGHLWMNWWDGNTWRWADQGTGPGQPIGPYAIAAATYDNRLYVFVQGYGDRHLWVNWWDGNSWQWADQGTPPGLILYADQPGTIAAITYETSRVNNLYTFIPASDGHLWVNWWSPPYYFIKSKLGNVIDIMGASTGAGAGLDAWPQKASGTDNQLWTFVPDPAGSGYYFIKSKLNGNVIDISGASTKAGALLDAWPQKTSGTDNQLWEFVADPAGSGYCFIKSKLNATWTCGVAGGNVIDIQGASTSAGALLDAYPWKLAGYDNQLWTVVDGSFPSVVETVPVPQGGYSGTYNYILANGSSCAALTGVKATIYFTEDLVWVSSNPDHPSFSIQLNAETDSNQPLNWLQFTVHMGTDKGLWPYINIWKPKGPGQAWDPVGVWAQQVATPPFTMPQAARIPAGYSITISLQNDPISHNVIGATYCVLDGSGNPVGPPVAYALSTDGGGGVPPPDLSPIASFQVTFGGAVLGAYANFSSGAGVIMLEADQEMNVDTSYPSCIGFTGGTAEGSNIGYGALEATPSTVFCQAFAVTSKSGLMKHVVLNAGGHLEVFAWGADGALWHNRQVTSGWFGWSSLSGAITSEPEVAANADGRLEVFARGTDGALWHRWQVTPGGWWAGWYSLGPPPAQPTPSVMTSTPTVGRNADGRLEAFARGTDGALWHNWQATPGGSWAGWASLGGAITSETAVAANADGRLEVFARGTDNALWHNSQVTPGDWSGSGWTSLGGVITSNPAVARNADGRLEVFAGSTDGALWHNWQDTPGGSWAGWASLGGAITSETAAAANADGRLEVFARGTDNALWHNSQVTPGDWSGSGWTSLGGAITSAPTVGQNADGRLEAFARGTDGALWHNWQETIGGWSGWDSLGGIVVPP